ncbi:DUF2834 domain-containing protein [Zhongshania aquimaris]|uniref:DUF2834 domain-containing protein n=1 Tax=Zhongshania aquimaris TaxID=2857107 RepID=A0ABS6VQK8_9GAMM|nr:DUF2834 domain-containing protein [Zhongshania aquimaris]MBW2940606.1 DUF2834 domain-containing protein [Zhongshania aquimaris]
MEVKTKLLVSLYVVIALLALLTTWIHLPAYLGNGIVEANIQFWKDALFNANPAGKFLVIDILFLAFTCNVWMIVEGRRLGVKYIYAYVVGGVLIAISVAFPLFMAARELKRASYESPLELYKIKAIDVLALFCLFLVAVFAAIAIL